MKETVYYCDKCGDKAKVYQINIPTKRAPRQIAEQTEGDLIQHTAIDLCVQCAGCLIRNYFAQVPPDNNAAMLKAWEETRKK